MKNTADVVVLGLGAHGSATRLELAMRDINVLGIDRFLPAHANGSSHGESRITRKAIGEGEIYTPLALRSYEIWEQLERMLGTPNKLLLKTGGLVIGTPKSEIAFHGNANFLGTTIKAAEHFNIEHERFSSDDIRAKFPMFNIRDEDEGYYEPDAGILFPERCVLANHEAAIRFGARARSTTQVFEIVPHVDSVTLRTSSGTISAGKVVIAAGSWVQRFLPEKYQQYFRVTRQTLHWFRPKNKSKAFGVGCFPIFIWSGEGIYGFPDIGRGLVKVAEGDYGTPTNPDEVNRNVSLKEIEYIRKKISPLIPELAGEHVEATTCLYTLTPDGDFVIDWHPDSKNILFVSACSGHGFKHSAAIGELAAKLVLGEPHGYTIEDFSLSRFNTPA